MNAHILVKIGVALAAQPEVLEKIRDGKLQAAGAVMKAVRGQADAARVRELMVERVNSYHSVG